MKNPSLFLLACAAGLILVSCATPSPQARIDRNPALFATLEPRQQDLVRQGRIDRGLSRDGVFLAWGPPDQVFEGAREGAATERWDYTASRAVHTTHAFGGFGWGRPYSRYSHFAAGPEVIFVPYRAATVWFRDGLVDSWERIR